ncbi:MAG: AhpC/TSA family protein [Bacteroidetes bacterium]|uniref:AhpC/TSA family protein n=1 Tax=Candidatus Cryptobacteroides intestinigallinarum TaxID=2840767 RepID=A0A9D9HLX1_9BACT|nr:AhpC/TSA family protein [Candidatus Cryptobacteroides intestinigallinarum]
MKSFSLGGILARGVVPVLAAAAAVSCGRTASVEGVLADAAGSEVVVKMLDVNHYEVLDTVKVSPKGHYSYKVDIEKGQPEFVYVFYGDTKIASLLLDRGDKVSVTSDTLGNYTVSGSAESEKLSDVEKKYSDFSTSFDSLALALSSLSPESEQAAEVRKEMGASYIAYYRDRLRYIMENPYSLTCVPVLFQVAGSDALPVFGQDTDAIHYRNICDSLETVYPESKYVKALRAEADRRSDILEFRVRVQNAEQVDYPDITLTDINANKVSLSEVGSKVVLLHFWSSADPRQKMFNLDVLKPIYDEYHQRGLEIYQVALDADKATWARTVKDQGLGWINVCDVAGLNSTAARLYNVNSLPVSFVIADGKLAEGRVSDAASLRKLLDSLL